MALQHKRHVTISISVVTDNWDDKFTLGTARHSQPLLHSLVSFWNKRYNNWLEEEWLRKNFQQMSNSYSASEATALRRYTNLIIIIIIWESLTKLVTLEQC